MTREAIAMARCTQAELAEWREKAQAAPVGRHSPIWCCR